jgi:hypothetical protein
VLHGWSLPRRYVLRVPDRLPGARGTRPTVRLAEGMIEVLELPAYIAQLLLAESAVPRDSSTYVKPRQRHLSTSRRTHADWAFRARSFLAIRSPRPLPACLGSPPLSHHRGTSAAGGDWAEATSSSIPFRF